MIFIGELTFKPWAQLLEEQQPRLCQVREGAPMGTLAPSLPADSLALLRTHGVTEN